MTPPGDRDGPIQDVIVVGGGLTGLVGAWHLRDRDVLLLEADQLPFQLPLSLGDRISLARIGLRLKAAHRRAVRADACGLLGGHVDPPSMGADPELGTRSFASLMGPTGHAVHELLGIAANRAAAEPDQVSAHYVSLSPISAGETPRFNVVGGTEQLIRTLQRALGKRARTGAKVTAITQSPEGVRVAGFFTRESVPLPWANRYMVVALNRSFCLLFNSANASRAPGTATGGGFIVYAGGRRAQELLPCSDSEIAAAFIDDLATLAHDVRRSILEVAIQRWPLGDSITTMGRSGDQAAIASSEDRLYFAGDYIGHPGMDSAASTAIHAAGEIRHRLEREEVRPAA